ncbi:Zinc transporter zip9-like [Plakobranchus ocellatus]|uniref:Zinc transporter zip9-like n=1 Tax=Plakobranchus ocellatus TaxID=259542 RepID=A0AAV3ZMZ2_9GAST|nr:Zinc transporter zip9-like [Plakobranchus ocellatus]
MDDIFTLLSLSLAMLVGCYLAGVIPLTISLSEDKLKLVTVLGAGLLVGTALAVIIPEGVHAMYVNGQGHGHDDHHVHKKDLSLVVNPIDAGGAHQADSPALINLGPDDHIVGAEKREMPEAQKEGHETGHASHSHHHDMSEEHSKIGVSLVLGFIFMLLVDQIGGSMHSHGGSSVSTSTSSSDLESAVVGVQQNRNKMTATLGLVVHAAADGIALGAAIKLSETHITMIVFIAIMLHKAPAAFGLVSFLLHEGLDRTRIRKHLAAFSAAAPLLAIITYLGLSQQSKESLADMHTTGIAMLFSAGTFLYVATVHVLPEISTSHTQHKTSDGTVIVREHKGFKKVELFTLVLGSLLPVVLALGHKH